MIDRMLHPPLDKNKLLLKHNVHTVKEHMAEYKIDSRSVYVILDQICKNADLYVSSSISPREKAEEHFMPSIPGG